MKHSLFQKSVVLFDLGDTIMVEESEVKDTDNVTVYAELISGMKEVILDLRSKAVFLGLVADTRLGTCENVLKKHEIYNCFSAFSISEIEGVEKPHPLLFQKALAELSVEPRMYSSVIMVGNNVARDIAGARKLGLTTVWFHWNDRYPAPCSAAEEPDHEVNSAAELRELLYLLLPLHS